MLLLVGVVAAIVAAVTAQRLNFRSRALAIVTAAAIVPLAIILTVTALVSSAFRGGQGDINDLAAAALILIGLAAAAASFVIGALAAFAALHFRRAP